MPETNDLTQTQLTERWQVIESTLERWRSAGIRPIHLMMMGRIRYRLSDITDVEEDKGDAPILVEIDRMLYPGAAVANELGFVKKQIFGPISLGLPF